jgi:RimJ/RimL family protein N-acetyltransferase
MFVQELHEAADFQDEQLINEIYDFWNRQDKRSIYLRFGIFQTPKREDYEIILRSTQVVIFARNEEGQLIGYSEVRRCISNENHVEFALATDMKYRHKGVALEMVVRMFDECSCQGIEKVEAYVMHENLTMRALIAKITYKFNVLQRFEDGDYHVLIDLTAAEQAIEA